MTLVDTCVWSLALRRSRKDLNPHERYIVFALRDLIAAGKAKTVGPIRQELLSGISSLALFEDLQEYIESLPDVPLTNDIWTLAAQYFNTCRANGIAPAAIDMTICAAAVAHALPIFTSDPDFTRYATVLPVKLFKP